MISHEHYRGYEINRCEEDQIRKRRGRYDDSGIIAYGGYVELSRETWTRGSGFGVGVRSWASRRDACESNWIFDGGGWESGSHPFLYRREFPHEESGMVDDWPEVLLTTPVTVNHICSTERQVIFLWVVRITLESLSQIRAFRLCSRIFSPIILTLSNGNERR